jgi:hypothetical protein
MGGWEVILDLSDYYDSFDDLLEAMEKYRNNLKEVKDGS